MGSFAGVNIDALNLQEAVNLAEQKKLALEQSRLNQLSQSLTDYRNEIQKSAFPDGQYYVTSDFTSQKVIFQGDAYNPNQLFKGMPPVLRQFKKGELVDVFTITTDMAMSKAKVIRTSSGDFYADFNNLSTNKPIETISVENSAETKRRNENKTKIIIIGAFILGYLLSND